MQASFTEEMTSYFGEDGLVMPRKASPSNNGVLYTAIYMMIAERIGEYENIRIPRIADAFNPLIVQPGLIRRSKTCADQEGPDDYVGFLAVAHLYYYVWAEEFLAYGWSNYGCYNNVDPGQFTWSAFLWRQPQLIAHAKYAAYERPNVFLRFAWIMTILLAGFRSPPSNTDARTLSWLLIQVWDGNGFFCKLAVNAWKKRLFRDYPCGMKDVFRIYFGDEHPFTTYVPNA